MRVMFVINSFGAGGAERHLLALASHMVRSGHSVLVIALTGAVTGGAKNIVEHFTTAGVQTTALDQDSIGWLRDAARWFVLRKLAKDWKPDIVHSHLPRADLAASFVKRMLPEAVWISTVHDAYIKGVYSGYWVFRLLGWNWRLADHVIAVSGHAQRWAHERLRMPEGKTSIIYHGIAELPADIRAQSPVLDAQPFLIGCLARFEPRKGIATLVRAMVSVREKHPRARLVIAGSDPMGYANELRCLADKLQLYDAVDIQEFCDAPFAFLRSLDLFAFASVSEGFGIVLLEAMAVGLPVVASDIYPLNHIVLHGETGLLANPAEPEAFAAALINLLENPALAQRMGEAGRRRCLQEFSEEKMLNSTENLYLDLVGRVRNYDLALGK
jgi:glycosyltransferase involved in cell wall biosynthesis